jgi:hypothetical protein
MPAGRVLILLRLDGCDECIPADLLWTQAAIIEPPSATLAIEDPNEAPAYFLYKLFSTNITSPLAVVEYRTLVHCARPRARRKNARVKKICQIFVWE